MARCKERTILSIADIQRKSTSFRISRKEENTGQIQRNEELQYRMSVSEEVRETCYTYHCNNPGPCSKQEPDNALANKIHNIRKAESDTATKDYQSLTCFQRRRARPNMPVPLPRKRSKPKNIVMIKTTSTTSWIMRASLSRSASGNEQAFNPGDQVEWSCSH
jgi:hypothetical protein